METVINIVIFILSFSVTSEMVLNSFILLFTFLVIMYVELFMHRKPFTEQEIADCQKDLNRSSAAIKHAKHIEITYDVYDELNKKKKYDKAFSVIFAGVFLAFLFVTIIIFSTISYTTVITLCACGITLICYGLIRIAESKLFAIAILVFIIITATVMQYLFSEFMSLTPYAYWILCGFLLGLSGLTLGPKSRNHQQIKN